MTDTANRASVPADAAGPQRLIEAFVMLRKPYNPSTSGPQVQVHDRRAREINRGSVAQLVEVEVDDPYEPGAKIATVRSVRDDALADRLARGHIDQAQYMAGREFQRWFGLAEKGPRAVQWAEAVDGGLPREPLTDAQLHAGRWLAKCYRGLGLMARLWFMPG